MIEKQKLKSKKKNKNKTLSILGLYFKVDPFLFAKIEAHSALSCYTMLLDITIAHVNIEGSAIQILRNFPHSMKSFFIGQCWKVVFIIDARWPLLLRENKNEPKGIFTTIFDILFRYL